MTDAEVPKPKRAVSISSSLGQFAQGLATATIAGALVAGLLLIAATQRTTSFIADARTLNHAFVRAAEEGIRRRLGFDARVSEVRLERSGTPLTLRAALLIAGGGVVDLQVNRNGRGAVEYTGQLRARNIYVRRESVFGDVLKRAEERETPSPPEQHSVRFKQFAFESIRLPFSIGHGQLVLHDGILNGHLANVVLRGRVDLRTQEINVAGTYLSLSRETMVGIPTLLTGPLWDGIWGVRFAVQGPWAKPEVIVNPMWLIPPGMLRKIFELQAPEETNP